MSTTEKAETSESVESPKTATHVASGVNVSAASGAAPDTCAAALAEVSALVTQELLKVSVDMVTIVPTGTWEELGSEEEIRRENAAAAHCRPCTTVQFTVPRRVLLQQASRRGNTVEAATRALANYITKEASEDSRDLRPAVNTLYEVIREEVEVGVQAVPQRRSQLTQTHYARQVNAAVQAQPTYVDAAISHLTDLPAKESPALSAFLSRVLPRTLHCLTQNEEVAIYTDEFALLREDDTIVGARDDAVLLEKGNFTHAATKDRRVTSIAWRGTRPRDDCICIASVAPYGLEERVEAQRRCDSSVSLVWELSDPMHPRFVLESPNEVQVLQFSPANPNLIAGGAMNGQVYLWDLSVATRLPSAAPVPAADARHAAQAGGDAPGVTPESGTAEKSTAPVTDGDAAVNAASAREAGEVPLMPESVKGVTWEKDGDVLVPRLQPVQASRVELSHRRAVHDLQWLAPNLECTFDGKQTVLSDDAGGTHQFATVSDDGTMLVWDTRPEHLPADKLRKMKHQTKSSGHEPVWVPLLRYQLTKPDATGGGDLMGFRLHFDGVTAEEASAPSYAVAVGSTDGEFATCCAVAKDTRRRGSGAAVVPTFGNSKDARFVRHVVEAHAGPVYCMQRHPAIGDVYLTCGDSSFKVWRAGVDAPLFLSPYIPGGVTCAAWSPTRAAIVVIGTGEGKLHVWDLLDRNCEPLLVHHMVQDSITVLAFKPVPPRLSGTRKKDFTQQLVVGTTLGSFHWFLLPPVLSRGSNGERRQLRTMLEREARRVAFYSWRWQERRAEVDRYGSSAPRMLTPATGAHGGPTAPHAGDDAERAVARDTAKPAPGRRGKGGKGGKGAGARGDGGSGDDSTYAEMDDDLEDGYGYDPQRDEEFLALVETLRAKEEQRVKLEAVS